MREPFVAWMEALALRIDEGEIRDAQHVFLRACVADDAERYAAFLDPDPHRASNGE